jgi:hypothetical protein
MAEKMKGKKAKRGVKRSPKSLCLKYAIYVLQRFYLRPSAMLSMLFSSAIYALQPCYLCSSAVLSMLFSSVIYVLQQS